MSIISMNPIVDTFLMMTPPDVSHKIAISGTTLENRTFFFFFFIFIVLQMRPREIEV